MEENIQNQSLPINQKFGDSYSKSRGSLWKEVIFPAVLILLIILSGGVTGYFLAKRSFGGKVSSTKKLTGGAEVIQDSDEVGIKDVKVFRDTAQGKLEINDNGEMPEGSHKLIRLGGPSQTAYLTSSVIDLNQFVGKCIQVWGETFGAQKVGWLMDVGRVKVLENCPEF